MPALQNVALATALATSLMGGATALAQTTATPQGHTSYVTLTLEADGSDEPARVEGQVPCEADLLEELARSWMGQPACEHDAYAYAYPPEAPPPWKGHVDSVDDTTHITEDGALRHAVEITYRVQEENGTRLVHAAAGELVPRTVDDGATYSVPVQDGMVDGGRVAVTAGPAPVPSVEGTTIDAPATTADAEGI